MRKHILFTAALTAVALFASCASGNGPGKETGLEGDSHAEASDEIFISREKAAAAGIETATVIPEEFREVVHTSGMIMPAAGDEATIAATTDGIVRIEMELVEGCPLDGNSEMFSIISSNLQNGNTIEKARIAYEAAKKEYERASALIGSRIVSEKDFASIKEQYENARLAYEALSPSEDGSGVSVKAPFKGFLKSLYVKSGDYVTVGTPLAGISRNKRLVLRAEVSQKHYPLLGNITSANFRIPGIDETFSTDNLDGRRVATGKSQTESSYYIPVSFSIENRGNLIPGSFAEIWLLGKARKDVVCLPVSAITEEQGVHFVYMQKADGQHYEKREVSLGAGNGSEVEILKGIHAGETVVVKGAYNVRLASAGNAIPAHTHSH